MERAGYKKRQGSGGSKGTDFQVNLLTVVLLNTFKRDKWKISTENEDADIFDDVVVHECHGDVLIQAKTRKTKVGLTDLLPTKNSTKKDSFNLCKYFVAYKNIVNKFKVKNVVICTNAGMQEEALKYMILQDVDSESPLHCHVGGYCVYKFNDAMVSLLSQKLKEKGIKASQKNIKKFLEHLQFYCNYPSEDNIENCIGEMLEHMKRDCILSYDIFYLAINDKIKKWFQQTEGEYLNKKGVEAMFSEISRRKYEQLQNSGKNTVTRTHGRTPLQTAISTKLLEIAKYLIHNGADLNIQDNFGRTALHTAVSLNLLDFVTFLVNSGASVNIRDLDGYTALHLAVSKGHFRIVQFLVDLGANINIKER